MIPLTLKMRNFLSYRGDTPVFDFRTLHIACISGENGAGKSSFLEAIHWAIWGKARVDDTSELISRGESAMSVELIFEVNSIAYRITRSFTRERRNITKLDLAQASDALHTTWIPLNGSSITETQLKITRDIVGMSYDIFQNSAYLRQGKADAFVQLTSTTRREVIAEILEITRYEAFLKEAKRRRDEYNASIETLRGKINDDERIAAEIPHHTELLNDHEAKLERAKSFKIYAEALDTHQQMHKALGTLQTQQQERVARRQARQAELDANAQTLNARPTIESQYREFQDLHAIVKSFEQRQQQLVPLHTQRTRVVEALGHARNATEKSIVMLNSNINHYAELDTQRDELHQALTQIQNEIASHTDASSSLPDTLKQRDALQHQIDEIHQAIRTYQTDTQAILRIQQQTNELDANLATYDTIHAQAQSAHHARERITALERTISECRAQDAEHANQLITIKDQADKLKARRDTIQAGEPCPTCQTVMDDAHLSHAHRTFDDQLNEWRTTYSERKQQRKSLQQQIADADAEIQQLSPQAQQLNTLQQRLAKLDVQKQQRVELEMQRQQLAQHVENMTHADLTAQLETKQRELQEVELHIDTLRTQQASLTAQQQQATTLTNRLKRIEEQLQQRDADIAQLTELTHQLEHNLIGTEYIQQIAAIDTQIADIGFDEAALVNARTAIQKLGDIQEAYNHLQRVEATSELIQTAIADLTRDIEHDDHEIQRINQEAQRTIRIIETLQTHIGEQERSLPVQQMLRQADAAVTNYTDMVGRMKERLHHAEQALLRLEESREKLQSVEHQHRRFDTLANAFSSKGIQAMLINEYALPALEHEANRLLGRMTDNQLYLSFKTAHLTKQGNHQEVLEIEVSDAIGTRPLEAFSGGEAFRISFALRIALSKLLAHRAGRRLETLIIDEGFGTQDAQGRERLVEAINSISDEFRTILVITHVSEVRDMFPTQIHIRRTSQTSMWEISA